MVRHGPFEIKVTSPGISDLPEYDDPNPAPDLQGIKGPAIVKYIEAVGGAGFEVKYRVHAGFELDEAHCVCFRLSIDGQCFDSVVMESGDYTRSNSSWAQCVDGYEFLSEKSSHLQKFQFGALSVEEASEMNSVSITQAHKIGTVRVQLQRGRCFGAHKKGDLRNLMEPTTEVHSKISESAIKGLATDLKTKLAEPVENKRSTWLDVRGISEDPILTVILKYRSHAALIKGGVLSEPHASNGRSTNGSSSKGSANALTESDNVAAGSGGVLVRGQKQEAPTKKRKHNRLTDDDDETDRAYLKETFKKVRQDMEAIIADKLASPRKLERQKIALFRKFDSLQDEVLGVASDDDEDSSDQKAVAGVKIKKESTGDDVMEISDDDN